MGRILGLAVVGAAAFVLAAPAFGHTDGGWQLTLQWPAAGTISRGFDADPANRHDGVDIGQLRSLDVTAAAPGVVEEVGEPSGFEGYGELVLVDLGYGFQALYAHLSDIAVQPGQLVAAGQHLGTAGCTGLCDGTHLHFEVRLDGQAFDPLPLLPATIPGPVGG